METRKVQQVGGGTYTVSIPVDWAEAHGVEAGGTAYLYTHSDGSLVVRWDEREESDLAATTVELDGGDPDEVRRALDAAYAAGFKRVTLRAADGLTTEQRRAISARSRTLTGVDVTAESGTRVTVQGLLDASDVSVRQSVLQLRFIALSTHEAAVAAVAGEAGDVQRVLDRTDETGRIARFVERHFNRALVDLDEVDKLGLSRPELCEYYHVAHHLERVAGHAETIARTTRRTDADVPDDLTDDVRALGDDARRVVEDATDAVLGEGGVETAHAAHDRRERVRQRAEHVEQASLDGSAATAHLLTRVLDRLVRTAERGGDVADLALRPSLRA